MKVIKLAPPDWIYVILLGTSIVVSAFWLQGLSTKQAREVEQIQDQYIELKATDEQLSLAEYLSSMMAHKLSYDIKFFFLVIVGFFGMPCFCLVRLFLLTAQELKVKA